MKEHWTRWGPTDLSQKYYIVAVSDTVRALRIKLNLQYLSDQSFRLSETRNFIHFAILAINSIMDIIAYQEPVITIKEKK